jgi:hypothetical protein
MPTDIALVLMRKAQLEMQASEERLNCLIIGCLLATLGLALTALMIWFDFDAEIAVALVTAG